MIQKTLKSISLDITEEEYRNDGCMHYSTLSSFERGGFHCISSLGEKKESPSLTFGSIVDTMMTDGMDAFNEQYFIGNTYDTISEQVQNIIKSLYQGYGGIYSELTAIPSNIILEVLDNVGFGKTWKKDTRLTKIYAGGAYYEDLVLAGNKKVISSDDYNDALACVRALKESPATKNLFAEDTPFEDIERCYQPIFRATFDGITYSAMMDLIYVDHKNKVIVPCDLKTSSHYEDEFYKSFIDWNYQIQGREYYAILEDNLKKDDYFKDFTIMNWHFIVVNRKSLIPLVWEFKDTKTKGTLVYGSKEQYKLRDPFEIAKELAEYREKQSRVTNGVFIDRPNDIIDWLNKK